MPNNMTTTVQTCAILAGIACASVQMSACGGDERAPLAEQVIGAEEPDLPTERLPQTTDAFAAERCWAKIPGYRTQCGVVTVPLSPGSEDIVSLGVMRIFSNDEVPEQEPLIYLEGGPGGAVLRNADLLFDYFETFVLDRDLILFDQRGTGVSLPSLSCASFDDTSECYAKALETTEPSAYSTRNNAHDVDAIRRAFGYEKVNLLGISYGTRLALTVMRDFPEGVRSAVIDAVVPLQVDLLAGLAPNAERAFLALFAACAVDSECHEKYPDSLTALQDVVAALDEHPYEGERFDIDGKLFVSLLFNLLYSPEALGLIPLLIQRAQEGDFELLEEISLALSGGDFSDGMHLSVQCAEELPFTSRADVLAADESVIPAIAAGVSGREYFAMCEDWPVEAAPLGENEPVHSPIPTLALAGMFDPITPPSYTELAAETLSSAFVYVLSSESHGSSVGTCGSSIVREFLKNPREEPSSICLSDLPSPEFESLRASRRGVGPLRHVGRPPSFATQRPSAEEIARVRRDLELRLHL